MGGGKNDVTVLLINTSISFPEGVTYTGYLALCAAMNRAIDSGRGELTQPAFFQSVSRESLGSLLQGDQGVDIPLLEDRVACLHQVIIGHVTLRALIGI